MSSHNVSLSFKVEGILTDLFVFANGIQVKKWLSNSNFVGGFSNALADEGTALKIKYVLIGLNGTDYKITSQFLDNSKAEEGSRPTPIAGTIQANMKAEETLTYTV